MSCTSSLDCYDQAMFAAWSQCRWFAVVRIGSAVVDARWRFFEQCLDCDILEWSLLEQEASGELLGCVTVAWPLCQSWRCLVCCAGSGRGRCHGGAP